MERPLIPYRYKKLREPKLRIDNLREFFYPGLYVPKKLSLFRSILSLKRHSLDHYSFIMNE